MTILSSVCVDGELLLVLSIMLVMLPTQIVHQGHVNCETIPLEICFTAIQIFSHKLLFIYPQSLVY